MTDSIKLILGTLSATILIAPLAANTYIDHEIRNESSMEFNFENEACKSNIAPNLIRCEMFLLTAGGNSGNGLGRPGFRSFGK